MRNIELERVHVAVGVVSNSTGEILLSRRAAGTHQGGLWEFPGGKVEPGEKTFQALQRELGEELAIDVHAARRLIKLPFDYPDKRVMLDVLQVTKWSGAVVGRQGQALQWVGLQELSKIDFPAANQAIVTAVRLPSLYLITPSPEEDFLARLAHCLVGGAELVQLRAPELNQKRVDEVAKAALSLCHDHGATLLVNTTPDQATAWGTGGVHLSSSRLMQLATRSLPAELLLGASCHSASELRHAEVIGCDFAVLGPVKVTASHPETRPLGWPAFEELVSHCCLPVYALGGMRPSDLSVARDAGAQGLAMISGIWDAPDPAAAVAAVTIG